MPLHTESSSTHSPQDFCVALKAARERKGITLDEISNATKIPAFLLAGLERNDLRRWPKGLYRRSFFRDYVRMIGLPVSEWCADFVRLFPDDPNAELNKAPAAATDAAETSQTDEDLRLALDPAWHGPPASLLSRLIGAVSQLFRNSTPESTEEPETRTWQSDARRVGPPRIRVRIKMS